MSKDLFFEIGTEEIPARFIDSAILDMKNSLESQFNSLNLNYKTINIYSTPRRFAINIIGLDEIQPDIEEEFKGPAKKISYDENGNLTKSILGFLKGKGASEEDLYFKKLENEEYAYVTVKKKGVVTTDILKDIFDKMIRDVAFPKSMRWGGKNLRFVRPIRWLVCIFGEDIIKFNIEGIETGNKTKGHRFLGKEWIEISDFKDYVKKLEENFVILEQDKRKALILEKCNKVASELDGFLVLDEDILNEVNYIVEYPTAFYGSFREEYLKLPKEVVTTPMQAHQRYFPVVDKDGKLMNKFITVRNGDEFMIDNVRKGNEKVLEARLSDAEFFYKEDTKKHLDFFIEKLSTITFQQKLGTILDKTHRIKNMAMKLSDKMNYDKTYISRAAELCKVDLTTMMVFEFTELQGLMGKYYAEISKEPKVVSDAIFEHYLPRNAGDDLPSTSEGIILSIADKMDSLAGFFAIGITPTGSQDPYALRRQALGILNILKEKELPVTIEDLIEISLDNFSNLEFDRSYVKEELFKFFMLRFENILSENGVRYDVINSIMSLRNNTIVEKFNKAKALNVWCESDISQELSAYSRVANLTKNIASININESLFIDDSEKKLWEKYIYQKKCFEEHIKTKDYIKALNTFKYIIPSINNMFDTVMIMDKDESIKGNRLSMLVSIKDTMNEIGDLSEIVYK
ncbi:MAG: glycine--tRNA ligase subunit beta [Filifactoraceae bacterium]